MKKFAPFMIAASALAASAVGCSAETNNQAEMTAEDQAAACSNPDGTNAAIAALATAIAQELHRWNVATDFYSYVGYNNQMNIGLTSAGLAACGGSCPMTSNILALQDTRMDMKVVFNGVKLSSWNFASRLYSGFQKQQTCKSGGWCPFVAHTFGSNVTTAPGACDTMFTFPVTKTDGSALSATEIAGLKNALIWTAANGDNPYIAFQSTASTVSIDPTGDLNPPGQTTGSEICQKFSATDINGTTCTCAANNIYSNGALKNDLAQTPKMYYCRQM